jgi:hypothetical protein
MIVEAIPRVQSACQALARNQHSCADYDLVSRYRGSPIGVCPMLLLYLKLRF